MTRTYSDKALRSFFGARPGGQDRPQDINTPLFLVDAILELWPSIALDPCSNPTSIVPAKMRLYEYETISGLHIKWPNYTYANPPYRETKLWLRKARQGAEHLILCPVRTNRRWWCQAASLASKICYLKPFAFLGHKQAFPTPLAMLYYGKEVAYFQSIFSNLGVIGRFIVEMEDDLQMSLQIEDL